MRLNARRLLGACGLVLLSSLALYATPGFWETATQADFLRGEVENLSIDEHGRLMLGPAVERVNDPSVPFVWALLPAPDGGHFLGTGNDGKVIRVDKARVSSIFFDSAEMEVHALASAPNGGIYVGTSPEGRIYRVDARGQSTTFFDPDDKYIWAIAVDHKGIVYAATGDKGAVYRITPDGKGERLFASKTTHVTTLAVDASGQVFAGTGSPGRVFRLDASGKGFLLLDTPYQEVKAMRFDSKGVLFVAAQSGRGSSGDAGSEPPPVIDAPRPPAVPNVSTEITGFTIIDVPVSAQSSGSSSPSGDRRNATGAIYRVLPDGLSDQLWETREDQPYDVAVEPDGALLVATGGKGKIFRLAGNPMRPTLLTRVAAQQATMLHRVADRTFVATANPGLLVAIAGARSERGTYESEVRDAKMAASWGTISWRATQPAATRIELSTRSGNTRTPDEAWSDWSAAYGDQNGSGITSPKARYLQWRAVLTGKGESPALTSVTAAYQQRNARPEVDSITVHPPGVVFQKPFSSGETEIAGFDDETVEKRMAANGQGSSGTPASPSLGRRTYQKGLQTFVWKASDDNTDELTFDVSYRREGETSWKLLKSGLEDSILVWDTTSMPNGSYVLKVAASDAKSNPSDTALRGERESSSFDVDNTPPSLVIGTSRREGSTIVVPFEVRDADSALTRVEYSLDAQRWQSAFPQDAILDGRQEQFSLRLDAAAAGRTLVLRATDAMNNVGSGQIIVR